MGHGLQCCLALQARDVPSQQTRVRRGDSIRLRAALEEEAPSLFDNNPQFASVFKQSLARQGQGALSRSSSPRPAREERYVPPLARLNPARHNAGL